MSKTTHYELNTPIGSEILSVMTGLNPNFTTIDSTMYDNETRSIEALNKANVNEQNIATSLGRITTAEGNIDTLESGLETANTNISGLTSRMSTAENNIVSANNRIQENAGNITQINTSLNNLTNDTGWIDLSSGLSYRKKGNTVSIVIDNSTLALNDWNTLGDLPEGLYPTKHTPFIGYDGQTATELVALSVNTAGKVSAKNFNGDYASHKGVEASVTYIV